MLGSRWLGSRDSLRRHRWGLAPGFRVHCFGLEHTLRDDAVSDGFFPPHSPSVLLSRFIGIKMTEALLHDACAGCKSKKFRNITGISVNYFRITISHFMVEHSSTYIQCETRVRELLRVACLTDGSSERQSTAKRDTWKRETRSKSEGFVPGVSSVNFPLSVPSEQGNTDNPDGISGIHDQHDLQDGLGSLSSRSSVSARCQIEAHVTVLSRTPPSSLGPTRTSSGHHRCYSLFFCFTV